MPVSDYNAEFCAVLAGSLAGLGLEDVCISPGSRNSPLIGAFAARDDIRDWSHHDERSAAFFAVGLARSSGRPVGLVCTSGTAATEYHPAIVEALQSRVPLIVMTADRPPELRDVGAPQAIDQIKLYGDHVKWFHAGAPPDADVVRQAPALAAHAWGTTLRPPPGPVHLNLPFSEPLAARNVAPSSVQGNRPTVRLGAPLPDAEALRTLGALINGTRCLFVVGALPDARAAAAVDDLAAATGAVVFADPQSGLRFAPVASNVIHTADLLAACRALDGDPPDTVVRWGALPTSKPVWSWLESHPEVSQALVDGGGPRDPLGSAAHLVQGDIAATASALRASIGTMSTWAEDWRDLDKRADAALAAAIEAEAFPNDAAIARIVMESAPESSAVFAGSSLPVRDIDSFGGTRSSAIRIFANRGANGIDGSISTALGIAASGTSCIALVGDVAALHDVGALATARRLGLALSVVVVHNDGGGIFSLLPQADPDLMNPAVFERHLATPHGTDFVAVATAFGLTCRRIESAESLREALTVATGPALFEVRTDRADTADLRRRLRAVVAEVMA